MAAHAGPNISTDSLRIIVDNTNEKGVIDNNYYNLVDLSDDNTFDQQDWMTGLTQFSACLTIEILGTNTTYAYHPINRWGNNGTSTASFVLYHFQQYTSPTKFDGNTNKFAWYGNVNGRGWFEFSGAYPRFSEHPKTHWIGVQYWVEGTNYHCQRWVDGSKDGSMTTVSLNGGTGALGSGTGGVSIQGSPNNNYNGIHWLKQASIYDRKISDAEMLQQWGVARAKHGL